jgi:ATP-binding cassette subfamily B protein
MTRHTDTIRRRSFLTSFLRAHAGKVAGTFALVVIAQTPTLVLPVGSGIIFDRMIRGGTPADLGPVLAVIFASLVLNAVTSVGGARLSAGLTRTLAARLRGDMVAHLERLSVAVHRRTGTAIVQTKLVRDVEAVETMLQMALPVIASVLVSGVGAVVITALRTPAFLLVFLLTVPLAVVLSRAFQRRIVRHNERLRHEVEAMSGTIGEVGAMVVFDRAHGLEDVAREKVEAAAERVRAAAVRTDVLNAVYGAGVFFTFQGLWNVVVGAAAVLSLANLVPISGGDLVMLIGFFNNLTNAVVFLLSLAPVLARGRVSARSIDGLLHDDDIEPNEGRRILTRIDGEVRFDGVGFRYPGAIEDAVSDLDITFSPGEVVALVGASGGGKSTIVDLVLGLARPTRGRVLIDGHDSSELDMRAVRRWVSVVPQDPAFFNGTIAENIGHGLPDVTEDAIGRALVDAYADEFVARLPEGLHSRIGHQGSALSGGQRQRLAIARALIRDPRILVLDEATSALDAESEQAVKAALDRLMRGRTSIVVAHRLATIRNADQIVVIERGRIVERGAHDELLTLRGRYARLHSAQPGVPVAAQG